MKRTELTIIAVLVAGSIALPVQAQTPAPAQPAPGTPPPAPAPSQPLFATTKVEGTDNVYVFRYQNHQAMFVVTPEGVIATDPIPQSLRSLCSRSLGRRQSAGGYESFVRDLAARVAAQ